MRWAEEQRRTWVCDFIAKNGRINRKDIMAEFGISKPQASIDLKKLQEDFPMLLVYNKKAKAYEAGDKPFNQPKETKRMQQFYGTKKIAAKPMTRAEYNQFRGWELPADENGADNGYLVEYLGGGKPNVSGHAGYVSWSPKEQFEAAYQPINGLSFGHAVVALKQGHKVARAGWNGKGMFLYHVPANSYPAQTEAARGTFGDMVPYGAYIAMKTAQNNVVPWLASQTDVLADDWEIVA
jgi:hypothetical protein